LEIATGVPAATAELVEVPTGTVTTVTSEDCPKPVIAPISERPRMQMAIRKISMAARICQDRRTCMGVPLRLRRPPCGPHG
jgi:hypothetical protein